MVQAQVADCIADNPECGRSLSTVNALALECNDGDLSDIQRMAVTADHYREAVGAKSYLAFCNTRGPANAPIMIPLMDKNDEGRRSHYLTIQTAIPDAPAADEIVVALGASVGGRPHHRIGDRYQDLKDLGRDVHNPAAV